MNRRTFLKSAASVGAAALWPACLRGATDAGTWRSELIAYLKQLRREDGGYAWPGEDFSHLTPTFAVAGCYKLLDEEIPQKATVAEFIRTHHPFRIKKLERELRIFEYQQIQGLLWLGDDAADFRDTVRPWKTSRAYPVAYEKHGYPIFQHEVFAIICRRMLGMPMDDLGAQMIEYLDQRRRADGTFNNTPASDGSNGHVVNTWWGMQALAALGRDVKSGELVEWLQRCQLPSGGFTYRPEADVGGVDDVMYTWAAVKALSHLGSQPKDSGACIRWLLSLWTADGAFADRPGWTANPMATWYALDALKTLGALRDPPAARARPVAEIPDDLKVFTIQLEAPGNGSPADAVQLAQGLHIHLWGAKNAKPGWIERAQAIADERAVPVKFFPANEEYGTCVDVPGLGTYSHISDLFAPTGAEFGQSLAGPTALSWHEFSEKRLAALEEAGGRVFWQFGENELYVRTLLDESIRSGRGYAAISTFHFGNPDFLNSESFLFRYRGVLPFVALHDAHGQEGWWWADNLTGFRTVFLAEEPTWESWLAALKRDWVMAIRRDAVSSQKLWMHGGASGVKEYVKRNSQQWQWWDNPSIRRPPCSVVAIGKDDPFETHRPREGVMLRVRLAWENTAAGAPKKQLADLIELTLDDRPMKAVFTQERGPKGGLLDHFYSADAGQLAPGKHLATATVRMIETQGMVKQTLTFNI